MATGITETQAYLNQRHAFCGSIKCPIRRLRYEPITVDPRQLDAKNVARLLGIFNLEGCRRLEPQNHVPALISQTVLDALLEHLPEGQSSLKPQDSTPVHIDPGHDLKCLHGRHRIEAAKRFLHPDDKWWIVDLYADGKVPSPSEPAALIVALDLGETEVNGLREEYSNAKNFFDGDIFRHLRQAHLAGDTFAKARWLSKLSKTKIRDINQLEKRAAKDAQTRHLQSALDDLLPFTGLWPALQIGTFHRLLSLRCPEEMTRYLKRIKITWDYILGEEEEFRSCLDAGTVTILEGRCPKISAEDERLLQKKQSGLFSTISVLRVQSILARVQKIDYIIPSIHTFLEDTKILEPCAKIMKKLLPTVCRTSILQEFSGLHNGQTSWSLQTSEASYCHREEGSSDMAHKSAYRQLWLYTIRHFPEMIGQPLRKDPPRVRSPLLGVELVWWYRLTALAEACGYAEVDKTYHRGEEADFKMAQTFLQQVRPPQLYGITTHMGSAVQQMVELLGKDHVDPDAVIDTYGVKCGPDITSRCGVPFERAFRKDQKALFLQHIDQRSQQGQQDCIGSYMVKQDTFHRFFGSSEISYESHPRSSPGSPGPLEHHSNEIDDFTSTRPPDMSSAEAEMDIVSQEELPFTSNPPPAEAHPDFSASLVAIHHSPMNRTVTRAEALRIFEEKSQGWDPDRLVILRRESTDAFTVFTFNRQDKEAISQILPHAGDHEYQVSDENRSKRMRMTNPRSIPDEPVVMIGDPEVRRAYEEIEEL